jgi:predicted component of type VI protein secretion system
MIPKLNELRDTCTAGEVTLKKGETIDYKSAVEKRKISMGKIADFIHPGERQGDKTTVWMRIIDIQNNQQSEWISVIVWYEQFKKGLFTKLQTTKAVKNDSEEQEDDNLPF